jgi:hypothetical protein
MRHGNITSHVYAAIELSKKSWVVPRLDRDQPSIHRIRGQFFQLLVGCEQRRTFGRILVCYEAGYDFWLAR